MVHASVIVCTHNPRLIYLRRVLEALRSQTLPLEQWELLLIDNASSELLTSTTLHCDEFEITGDNPVFDYRTNPMQTTQV